MFYGRSYILVEDLGQVHPRGVGDGADIMFTFQVNDKAQNMEEVAISIGTSLYTNTTIDPACQDMDDLVDHVSACLEEYL